MIFKRSSVGSLFFLFALLPSIYYTPVLTFIIACLIVTRRGKLHAGIIRPLIPLLLIAAAGAVHGIFTEHAYDALKDLWYLGKLIVVFMLGYLLGDRVKLERTWQRDTILIASLATIPGLFFLAVEGSVALSQLAVTTMGAVILLPFYLQRNSLFSHDPLFLRFLVALPLLLTVLLSLSRTTILLFIASFVGSRGLFQSKSKIAISLSFLLIIIPALTNFLPEYDINNITFLGKLSNSLNEVLFVKGDSELEITANWRGFEAFRAFEQWQNGSMLQMIIGQGFGSSVDIGFYYPLYGDDVPPVRYLPILHNGYAMILVKYGVFGVSMFLLFCFIPVLGRYDRGDSISVFAKRVSSTASISLMLSMTIVTGPFNLSQIDGVTLIMGWAMGLQARRLHQPVRSVIMETNLVSHLSAKRRESIDQPL